MRRAARLDREKPDLLTPSLRHSLAMLAGAVADAADDWWIIGSSAVALHGANVQRVRDVDLLMSANDAERLLRRVGSRTRTVNSDSPPAGTSTRQLATPSSSTPP